MPIVWENVWQISTWSSRLSSPPPESPPPPSLSILRRHKSPPLHVVPAPCPCPERTGLRFPLPSQEPLEETGCAFRHRGPSRFGTNLSWWCGVRTCPVKIAVPSRPYFCSDTLQWFSSQRIVSLHPDLSACLPGRFRPCQLPVDPPSCLLHPQPLEVGFGLQK